MLQKHMLSAEAKDAGFFPQPTRSSNAPGASSGAGKDGPADGFDCEGHVNKTIQPCQTSFTMTVARSLINFDTSIMTTKLSLARRLARPSLLHRRDGSQKLYGSASSPAKVTSQWEGSPTNFTLGHLLVITPS